MVEYIGQAKTPWWFWVVAILALLWNLMGVMAYLGGAFGGEALIIEAYGDEGGRVMLGRPAWATAAFAIAVFGGTIGCIALLLRRSWAKWLFIVSLLGVLLQNLWGFFLSDASKYMLDFDKIMVPMVIIIAVFLLWFARNMSGKGILR